MRGSLGPASRLDKIWLLHFIAFWTPCENLLPQAVGGAELEILLGFLRRGDRKLERKVFIGYFVS